MNDYLNLPQFSFWVTVIMIIKGKAAHKERRYVSFARDGQDAMNQVNHQFSNLQAIGFEKIK